MGEFGKVNHYATIESPGHTLRNERDTVGTAERRFDLAELDRYCYRVAGVVGIAVATAEITKILFFIFVVIFVALLIAGLMAGSALF